MQRILSLAALSATLLSTSAAFAGPPTFPNVPNCSVVCLRETAKADTSQINVKLSDAILAGQISNADGKARILDALQTFEAAQSEISNQRAELALKKRVASYAFAAADDLRIGEIVPLGIAHAATDHAFDVAFEDLSKQQDGLAQNVLQPAFAELYREHKDAVIALKGQPAQQIDQVLFGSDGVSGLLDKTPIFEKLPPERRADFAELRVDLLTTDLGSVSKFAVATDAKVNTVISSYNSFRSNVAKFETDTHARLAGLEDGQQNLANAYALLSDQVHDDTYRLDALEAVTWRNLSPKEQLAALNDGTFSSVIDKMPGEQRQQLTQSLQRAAAMEDVSNASSVAANVADNFASLGHVVGVDLTGPAHVIDDGNVFVHAAINVFSGNPLAIVSGLGSLAGLFGGGADQTQLEFRQLRQDIADMRTQMFQYHKEEMDKLNDISEKIDHRFDELSQLDHSILDQTVFNTVQIDEVLTADLTSCHNFNQQWEADAKLPYDERVDDINNNFPDLVPTCRKAVQQRFMAPGLGANVVSTIFSAKTTAGNADGSSVAAALNAQRLQNELLAPLVSYTFREATRGFNMGVCNGDEIVVDALMATPGGDGNARQVVSAASAICAAGKSPVFNPSSWTGGTPVNWQSLLGRPLAFERVIGFGNDVSKESEVYELLDRPGSNEPNVLTLDKLRQLAPDPTRTNLGQQQLQNVLGVTNVAIAQMNLMGGDLVLEVLAQDIEAGLSDLAKRNLSEVDQSSWAKCDADGKPSAPYFNALCILTRDPVLRENFLRHWIRSRLVDPQQTPLKEYAVGMKLDYSAVLQSAFVESWPAKLEPCGETWCVRLPGAQIHDPLAPASGPGAFDLKGDIVFTLPDWSDVASDRQAVANISDMKGLMQLRNSTVQRIAEMTANPGIDAHQRQMIYASLLIQASPEGGAPTPNGTPHH